jgi:hypothetical protein
VPDKTESERNMPSSMGNCPANADLGWSVNVAGRVYGPYTGPEILGFVKEGRIAPHSIVRAGAEGPWITAIDDPFLVRFFVAETQRKQPVPAAATGAGVPVAATSQTYRRRASDVAEERNLVIIVDVRTGSSSPCSLELAIQAMGQAYRVTQNAWILRSKRSAGTVRNELTAHLGGSDRLFVADTSNSRTAWFNLGPEAETKIRKVWAG